MSSEEEARAAVIEACMECALFTRHDPSPHDPRSCSVINRALTAYRTAIEQRVLAQCTINPSVCPLKRTGEEMTVADVEAFNAEIAARPWPPRAAQTQETSG